VPDHESLRISRDSGELADLLEGVLRQVDGRVRYALRGEIDLSNAEQLLDKLVGVYDEHGPFLELDLADVAFIDSSGIRTLLLASREASRRGGALLIVRPSPPVVSVVRLSGFDEVLVMNGGTTWEDLES
jgi:anti-anti-sigma factor